MWQWMQIGLGTQRQGAPRLEECWQLGCASPYVICRRHKQPCHCHRQSQKPRQSKDCVEALYAKHLLEHQNARPIKIEVWQDSSGDKAMMERFGPGRRAKHLEVQTWWGSTAGKGRSHIVEQVEFAGKCCICVDKTRSASSTWQVSWNDELHVFWWRDSKNSSVREHQRELLESESCSSWEITGLRQWSQWWVGAGSLDSDSSHDSRFKAECCDKPPLIPVCSATTTSYLIMSQS